MSLPPTTVPAQTNVGSQITLPKKTLFLGDCNTSGTPDIEGHAYPELFAQLTKSSCLNCGHTMTTTREGSQYYAEFYSEDIDAICIQYGLVDSWRTFKYAPYVLYYPDSKSRKLGRKLTKKFKKLCKKFGLNRLFGTENVVPLDEYRQRLHAIITNAPSKAIVLIETIPNKDTGRNPDIERYNALLADLAEHYKHCFLLPIYDDFAGVMQEHYSDPTHLSKTGHRFVAEKLHLLFKDNILGVTPDA